ncbi:PREDICTED: uncharacterized protein LOC108361237 [Rhagoletis zephyria]|uniref:uncharacterized protein LOC108361237 n=1 Tax=Rhagoletis zephyria TaxID=28612 RepID=UPI0008115455|nr:PREDICTED: uncharacterized protein LOC108361237 [Rhagoletis zephyria]
MEENHDLARGFVREIRENLAEFRKQLTLELNSAGPPAWNDQKRYVRKKASQNKAMERGTGRGPNRTQKFSPSEETIYELVGMKEAVEGVGTSQAFGLPTTGSSPSNESNDDSVPSCSNVAMSDVLDNSQSNATSLRMSNGRTSVPVRRTSKMSMQEVAMKELENQEELCSKIGEAVWLMVENAEQTQINLKRLHRSLERSNRQRNMHLAEMKRHNLAKEKLKKEDLAIKRRMLQIKEEKLVLLRHKKARN